MRLVTILRKKTKNLIKIIDKIIILIIFVNFKEIVKMFYKFFGISTFFLKIFKVFLFKISKN